MWTGRCCTGLPRHPHLLGGRASTRHPGDAACLLQLCWQYKWMTICCLTTFVRPPLFDHLCLTTLLTALPHTPPPQATYPPLCCNLPAAAPRPAYHRPPHHAPHHPRVRPRRRRLQDEHRWGGRAAPAGPQADAGGGACFWGGGGPADAWGAANGPASSADRFCIAVRMCTCADVMKRLSNPCGGMLRADLP